MTGWWSKLFGGGSSAPPTVPDVGRTTSTQGPSAASQKSPPEPALAAAFGPGLLTLALQPKTNHIDLGATTAEKLFVFLIDHDYPGGSAAMHNAVFSHLKLPYRSLFAIGEPTNVGAIVRALREDGRYAGGGAGSGFKDKVGPHLDRLDPSAEVIGSVNVIVREPGGALVGHNTDGIGFVAGLLAEYPGSVSGAKIVILGAGGTALPISYELARAGAGEVVILNRTVAKAQAIADLIAPLTRARAAGEDVIGDEIEGADIVVNTSNKGAQPNEKFSAFAPMTGDVEADLAISKANLARLPKTAIVADILLEDAPLTLELARAAGHRTHSGRHMNLYQAAPAFRLITGVDATDATLLPIMKAALAA